MQARGVFAMQYTIRNIPPAIDRQLRERAGKKGKSLNETVLDTIREGLGISENIPLYDDMDDLVGTWKNDEVFERVMDEQDTVDPELWR